MTMRRFVCSASACALACVTLLTLQTERQGAVSAAGAALGAGQAQAGRGGGRGAAPDTPVIGQGTLMAGAWGAEAVPVDSRGWGWMTQSYVSSANKRPFWNKAKELLFSGKQVTSYTISSFDTAFYCEVRKHYGYVWFEMQDRKSVV